MEVKKNTQPPFVIPPIGITGKTTKTFVIVFSIFILISAGIIVVVTSGCSTNDYTRSKIDRMTDDELLDAYQKVAGKRPLCVLDRGISSDNIYQRGLRTPKFLFDIARIDCDTIGDGDILLQYECSELKVNYSQLKKQSRKKISESRSIILVHYIRCEEEEEGYKARYYHRYNYHYICENGSSNFFYKTDMYARNEWLDCGHVGVDLFGCDRILGYYEAHKSEIPVIAEDIMKKRTYVKFGEYDDRYVLTFNKYADYEDFIMIAEHLQEHYGATIFDRSYDLYNWSASVKIGESVMKLSSARSHFDPYKGTMLEGSSSDMSIMEEIADDFESRLSEIQIRWVNDLPGDFSFRDNWSYPEGADTTRLFHSMESEGENNKWTTSSRIPTMREGRQPDEFRMVRFRADFISVERIHKDSVICYAMNRDSSCLNLVIAENTVRATMESNGKETSSGKIFYYCSKGKMTIDKNLWEQGILKATFDFKFDDKETAPYGHTYWRGKIYTEIKK